MRVAEKKIRRPIRGAVEGLLTTGSKPSSALCQPHRQW